MNNNTLDGINNWPIIQAMIRCGLANNPTEAFRHQVVRLQQKYERDSPEFQSITEMLYPDPSLPEFKIERSQDGSKTMPEETLQGANAAQVLAGFLWHEKNRPPLDMISGSIVKGFSFDDTKLLPYLMRFQDFILKGISPGVLSRIGELEKENETLMALLEKAITIGCSCKDCQDRWQSYCKEHGITPASETK